MPEYKLRPHQKKAVEEYPDIWGIWWKPRTGKTFTVIRLASSRTESCIVVVLKSLVEQWEEHVADWNDSDCKFKVISKETFRRDWEKLDRYESVAIDESHIGFHNFKAQLHKAAISYIKKHNIKYIWLATATPYTSSSFSIYSAGKLLRRNWSWYSWKKRFFNNIRMGTRFIPVQKKGIEDELAVIINRIGSTLSLSDISEQSEDEHIKEYFDLNIEQKRAIKDTFDPLPIVMFSAYHQIENGTKLSDGYNEDRIFKCEKTNRLIELVGSYDKIAIVARYNLQLNNYKKEILIKYPDKSVYIINGATKNKNEIIKQIEKDKECVVLLNSMCSAGYSLSSIDTMVFTSMDFSFVNFEQISQRVKNLNKNKSCTYIYLLTRKTKDYKSVDQRIYDCVMDKKDFDYKIFNT